MNRLFSTVARASLAVLFAVACNNSSVVATAPPPPTAVAVDPAQFLGDVACLDEPGGMRLYVATLIDVSPSLDAGVTVIPSSPPTSCFEDVLFERIVLGRDYTADVDGYDTDDIEPLAIGSRTMVDKSTHAYVAPRWTTSCGNGAQVVASRPDGGADLDASVDAGRKPKPVVRSTTDASLRLYDCVAPHWKDGGGQPELNGPVCAETEETQIMQGCYPLRDRSAAAATTGLRVDLTDALGGGSCSTERGDVKSFTVRLQGVTAAKSAACGSAVEFDGLAAGEGYSFTVEAAVGVDGGKPWSTTCFQTAIRGVVVRAACDPFPELHSG